MGRALADRFASVHPSIRDQALRFGKDAAADIGWMLARGTEIVLQQGYMRGQPWNPPDELDERTAQRISEQAATQFDLLLRRYAEEAKGLLAPRPSPDLDTVLIPQLQDRLLQFLLQRCRPGGDLHACIADPAGDDAGHFDATPHPRHHAVVRTGRAVDDLYRLGVVIDDSDTYTSAKDKLYWFCESDPWMKFEFDSRMVATLADSEDSAGADLIAAIDGFLFAPCRLDGKTPVELLLERQVNMPEQQRRRLTRWIDEPYEGIFHIKSARSPEIVTTDLHTMKTVTLEATRPEGLRSARPGHVVFTRVVPWEDKWFLSGAQDVRGPVPDNAIPELRTALLSAGVPKRADPDGRILKKSLEAQGEQYDEWVKLFGADEICFDSGQACEDAMHKFHHHMSHIWINPRTGMTPYDSFRQRYKSTPPKVEFNLPEDLLTHPDIGSIFDRIHGQVFLPDYRAFLSAFETEKPSIHQLTILRDYLVTNLGPYWLFARIAARAPIAFERTMRTVLRDETFKIEDLDRWMRKLKPVEVRRGIQPSLVVLE
jgi:hypothetical protein